MKCYFENEEVLLSEPDPIPAFHIIQYLYACYVYLLLSVLGLDSQVASPASWLVFVFWILSFIIGIARIYTYISYNRETDKTRVMGL